MSKKTRFNHRDTEDTEKTYAWFNRQERPSPLAKATVAKDVKKKDPAKQGGRQENIPQHSSPLKGEDIGGGTRLGTLTPTLSLLGRGSDGETRGQP